MSMSAPIARVSKLKISSHSISQKIKRIPNRLAFCSPLFRFD
jgi:hypothetical protein